MNDFAKTWDNMTLRERIAHLLADWRQSKDTTDPMVLRIAATMAHHQLEEADAEIADLEFRLQGDHGELEITESKLRTAQRENEDLRIGADNLDAEIERLRKALAEIAENGNAEPYAADHARDAIKANG